jgi:arylsulfatase A-like enzyme
MLAAFTTPADVARRNYAGGVAALDEAVGQIVAALQKKKMLGQTLLVFHSDNGGAVPMKYATGDGDVDKPAADNDLYREGKGSLYEGGVRVVALAHWPGKIKEKSMVASLMHVTDMYTTLLTLAGGKPDPGKKPDGINIWTSISEGQASPRREMLVNVEDFRGAMRIGEWKLIVRATLPSKIELYNVSSDPEEASNQADAYPERVKEMLGKLNAYAYDMDEAKHLEELVKGRGNEVPIFWGHNVPKR